MWCKEYPQFFFFFISMYVHLSVMFFPLSSFSLHAHFHESPFFLLHLYVLSPPHISLLPFQAVCMSDDYLFVVGGTTGFQYSIDVHRLDLEHRTWEQLSPPFPPPHTVPEER